MEKQRFTYILTRLTNGLRKYAPDLKDVDTLNTWYLSLKDIPEEKFIDICKTCLLTLDEHPTIAKLIRMSNGITMSDEEIASEVSNRIEGAIRSFGWARPQCAKDFIGEIGWEIVNQRGGWERTCDIVETDLIQLRKVWRDAALVKSKQASIKQATLQIANKGGVKALVGTIKTGKMPGSS